ncbi:MAG: putative metal-dependent hydrolase YcfH [Verrucomicrobiae bacterium]|nr:putative metal-dependent hydrolase YcfH [Verrucomicrobiae bacterium]
MFTDTHCHLSFPEFSDELTEVIARAATAGVDRIVSIATDLSDARRAVEIAGQHTGVFASVGLHPNHVHECKLCDMKVVAELAGQPKIVAVGETGLDYFRSKQNAPQQKDFLLAHLELAKECRLPLVIHNRAAETDLLDILRAHAPGFRPWGVMHCFSGDAKFAFDCLELGLLISFTGILTFKTADALREVARQVPLDKVMLETDAPYLAPVPQRGQRNEPAFVPYIAEVLAQVKGVPVTEVARVTSQTATEFFRL